MDANVRRIRVAVERFIKWFDRASRYDLVLAVIPAAFLLAGVLHLAVSINPTTAILAASILGSLAVVDALFLNPPRGPSTRRPTA